MKISCGRSCAGLAVLFLVCGLSSESVWAKPLDTKMLDITVTAKNPADQTSPNTFYLGAPLKVKCRYQWGADHPNSTPPPLEIRFYNDPHAPGENGIFGHSNTGLPVAGAINTAETEFKTDTVGTIDVSCRITQNGYLYQSAGSNQASMKINVVKPPGVALKGPAITKAKADPGGMPMLSPYIKQCPTSLSATVKVDAHQLAGPQQSPADLQTPQLMLHFQSAQAAGNNVVCRYATERKDVPDLVVTIKCPNASAQQGTPGAFNCTN